MKYFSDIFKQFLTTIKSNTLADMTDADLTEYLNICMFRAASDFLFPRVSLSYTIAQPDTDILGYYFTTDLGQEEINVLLALIESYWLEQQKNNEENMELKYFDKDVRTHSGGKMLAELDKLVKSAKVSAKKAQTNYGRSNNNKSTLKDIYAK